MLTALIVSPTLESFPIGVGRKGRDSEVTNCLISSSALPYAAPEGVRQSYLKPFLSTTCFPSCF